MKSEPSLFGCRHWLASIVFTLILNLYLGESRSFKSVRRSNRGTGDFVGPDVPEVSANLAQVDGASDDSKGSSDDVAEDQSQFDDDSSEEEAAAEENVDDVDKEAAAEEEQDQAEQATEEKREKQEQAAEKEDEKDSGDAKDAADEKKEKKLPERRQIEAADVPMTTPQPEPYAYMYTASDSVARDVELRRGADFHPQGTNPEVDLSKQEQFKIDSFFSQDPSIFGHCILIRDFAEPLRVGSALMRTPSSLRGGNGQRVHPKVTKAANSSHAKLQRAPERFVRSFASGSFQHQDVGADHDSKRSNKEEKTLPHEVLIAKGGVVDRDAGEINEADGSVEDDVEMEVSMFAFLRSVAGEVAVIPNGDVAKWSSKKKVPIAGYLCTTEHGPVLHTLPTPCLPTSLDENGQPFSPPMPPPRPPPTAPPGMKQAKGPAPAKPASPAAAPEANSELEEQAEAEAAAAEAVSNGPEGASMLQKMKSSPAPAAAGAGAPAPAAQELPLPIKPLYEPFHVWVGTTLLEFRSKPKAERFCKRLTKRIAEDIGDEEWDADRLLPEEVNKKDLSVSSFMSLSRTPSPEWTRGTKTCLVVVMDWMKGDSSRAPMTEQTKTPQHYKDKIFPRVRQAFQKMSYGQFDLSVTVVPEVVPFSKPRSRYTAGGYPFPGLYNGAKDSIEGSWKFGDKYKFNNYDLVYVISPQQAPTGTKGVAWVGAKGAMCNGCEAISENFQVMVAVHELGHNLGLWHAGSKSLEYGNVFDWMGNYPDVTGLSFGLGYKLRLHWLPQASIANIGDADLPSLNDEYSLMPFDSDVGPVAGQLTGIQIDLKKNRRAIYLSYRKEPGSGHAGIFLTMQDRDKPNSELIDCACHSPSQQDAALQQGWTYMDPSGEVVIHAYKVAPNLATVRIFKAPSSSAVASIRARSGFTDGQWKCPRVCTDADLLVSLYKGCAMLAQDGYCKGGSITMSGKKLSIGTDLCPKSCEQCDAATKGGDMSKAGCADRNVKISGMTCQGAAAKGYCDYSTNIGHIGDELCPHSCGRCPAKPPAASSKSGSFKDPTPVRMHGLASSSEKQEAPAVAVESEKDRNDGAAAKEDAEEKADDKQEDEAEKKAEGGDQVRDTCTDDAVWQDEDKDTCEVYRDYIAAGKLTVDEACNYGNGVAKVYCRKTCNTCQVKDSTCEDKQCVTRWRYERGKCFACSEWQNHCDKDFFAHDCPRTCGLCQAAAAETTPPLPVTPIAATTTVAVTMPPTSPPTVAPPCEDHDCVDSWMKSFNECHKCSDYAEDYCGRDEQFMQSCRKSCRMCTEDKAACHDDFLPHTCKRYAEWGWCSTAHIADHCKASCGLCAAQITVVEEPPTPEKTLFPGAAVRGASSPLCALLSTALLCLAALWH